MGELTHATRVEEQRRLVNTNSFTNFANCNILAADLEDATEYLLIVSCLLMGADTARNDFHFRLHDGSVIGDSTARIEPRNSSSIFGEMYFYMDRYTTPATAAQINFQGHTDGTSTTQRCISFYAVAIKISDLKATDFEDAENTTNLSGLTDTAWTEGIDITIGDGESDWMVFGYGRVLVDTDGVQIRMRLTDDGTMVGEEIHLEGEDSVEIKHMGFMWVLKGIPSSDINLEFQTDIGTSGLMDIDRCMLFALRLNQFEDYLSDHDTTDTNITATDTDFGTISVSHVTRTGGNSRDWMIFGGSVITTGDDIKAFRHHIKDSSTIIIGDSPDVATGLRQNHAGGEDRVPNIRFGPNAAVTHGTSFTANIKNQEDNDVTPQPVIVDQHMAWFTWQFKEPFLPYHSKPPSILLRM